MNARISIFCDPRAKSCWFDRSNPASVAELAGLKLDVVDSPSAAKVIVSDILRRLVRLAVKFPGRKYVLWTQEPRYDTHFEPRWEGVLGIWPKIEILNVYTGRVFLDPVGIYGHKASGELSSDSLKDVYDRKHKTCVFVSSFVEKPQPLWRSGSDLDLSALRQEVALIGHGRGSCDIYGRRWPDGISLGVPASKDEAIKDYRFNLCSENTRFKYYITEKIWDSVRNLCIPIYAGRGSGIFEIFEKNSFVDLDDYPSPPALFDYIENMDKGEYLDRLRLCIKGYNKAHDLRFNSVMDAGLKVYVEFARTIHNLFGLTLRVV